MSLGQVPCSLFCVALPLEKRMALAEDRPSLFLDGGRRCANCHSESPTQPGSAFDSPWSRFRMSLCLRVFLWSGHADSRRRRSDTDKTGLRRAILLRLRAGHAEGIRTHYLVGRGPTVAIGTPLCHCLASRRVPRRSTSKQVEACARERHRTQGSRRSGLASGWRPHGGQGGGGGGTGSAI
jgi:hypothetical protein